MLLRKISTAFLLLATVTIFSCKKDNNDNSSASCTNLTGWLANGHELVYENSPIVIAADTLYSNFTDVGGGVFKAISKYDDGTIYPTQTVYIQPCGNSIYQATTQDMANKQEAFRVDGSVGDSWTTTLTSAGGATVTTVNTIQEKNVSVTVAAGTFSCIKFHQVATISTGGSVTTDIYMNNSVGAVVVDGTTTHYELARKNF